MLTRFVRPNSFKVARLIHQSRASYSEAKTVPNKNEMLTLDWQIAGLVPQFFKGGMGGLFQRMTKDVDFEDKIFNYKIKDPFNLNIHLLKVRMYFRYKSPFLKMEYLGSIYYEGEDVLTVLWRLTSIKSSFIRYFPAIITGKKPESRVVEGALEVYVNSDAKIYKMINRLATEKDIEAAKQFTDLKKQSVDEAEQKAKDIAMDEAKRIADEKRAIRED